MVKLITLPDNITSRLHGLATLTGKNEASCVIEAMQKYLDDLEHIHLAEHELQAIEVGLSTTAPLAEDVKERRQTPVMITQVNQFPGPIQHVHLNVINRLLRFQNAKVRDLNFTKREKITL